MNKKTIKVGTIKDSELNKKIRKPLPPPGKTHTSIKQYKRKSKHKNKNYE